MFVVLGSDGGSYVGVPSRTENQNLRGAGVAATDRTDVDCADPVDIRCGRGVGIAVGFPITASINRNAWREVTALAGSAKMDVQTGIRIRTSRTNDDLADVRVHEQRFGGGERDQGAIGPVGLVLIIVKCRNGLGKM